MNYLTFDIDWAPDFAVEHCVNICKDNNTSAIFFATHESKIIESLKNDNLFEIGIHPNFNTGSSHGKSIEEVLDYFKAFLPNAKCMRSHSLLQSTLIFEKISSYNPKVKYDFSILMYLTKNLEQSKLYLNENKFIERFPFFFEDDIAMRDPTWKWKINLEKYKGIKIFNFHPSLIYLNSSNLESYNTLKSKINLRNKNEFIEIKEQNYGNENFLIDLIKENSFNHFKSLFEK